MNTESILSSTRDWLEKAVIGLNLCPFAKAVYVKQQVRMVVSEARHLDALLEDLDRELLLLAQADPQQIDTTLLIHPYILSDFIEYNDFLPVAEHAITENDLDGVLQIASFHPGYQFAGTAADDISNYTNRSPFPTLHLLREDSVERAVAAFPDPAQIFENNMQTLHKLGIDGWRALGLDKAE